MQYLEYKEKLTHGSKDFPFALYYVSPSHPRYMMQPHWHDECELIRIVQGELILMINQTEFHLETGDIVFISSGFLHSGIPHRCHYECIVFDMDYYIKNQPSAKTVLEPILTQQIFIQPYFSKADEELKEIFNSFYDGLRRRDEGGKLITEGALYQFLGQVIRKKLYSATPDRSFSHSKKSKEIKRVLNYIALHYTEKITLKDMADCVHMNSNYFCKFFKEMTHKSPMEYLNFYRIESACEILCISNDSILDVALKCGFNDVNYFIKVFKKLKGTTPLQYLKKEKYHSS